jgi:hypothetical protein
MRMATAQVIQSIRREFRALKPGMDERLRRQWAAAEARELGRGGITAVARATGMSRTTITTGCRELTRPLKQRERDAQRIRRPGGGRRSLVDTDPGLLAALEALLEPVTRGDPESPLRWTCKSTSKLAAELTRQNRPVFTSPSRKLEKAIRSNLEGLGYGG